MIDSYLIYKNDISNSIAPLEKTLKIRSKKERVYREFKTNQNGNKMAKNEDVLTCFPLFLCFKS